MSEIAVRVENLSKRYRIGQRERYYTLRETLSRAFTLPFRRLRDGPQRDSNGSSPTSDLIPRSDFIWALKDISFGVKRGEIVGIIGRNGAGKSTLLKILSRITEPTEGYAEVYGRVGSLLEVGTGFHPELTGRENIYLNGTILGMKRREIAGRFDEIVAFAEVEKFLDTPVKRYSSGMHMRLAFAVAAYLEPEILLVDEVLAVGDAAFQKKCLGRMGTAAKEGRTILFVSHNMAAVRSICSRGFLLSEGRLLFSGTIDSGVDQYLLSACHDMPTEIRTRALQRPRGIASDETLRFTRIKLETPADQAILYTGNPISLLMEFQVLRSVTEVVFAWSVHSSDHVRLFECQSIASFGVIDELKPGRYWLRCCVPENPLNPGIYTFHIGSRCASKGLDYLPEVMTFRVESTDHFSSLWLEAPTGFMRIPSKWSDLTEIAQA